MHPKGLDQYLSRTSASWPGVGRAAGGKTGARGELVQRYLGAAHQYLLTALGSESAAEELSREAARRVLGGPARPGRGRPRLRDALWAVLQDLVAEHRRGGKAGARRPAGGGAADADGEQDWLDCWRDELFTRTWAALAEASPGYFAVLVCALRNPQEEASELARKVAAELGKKQLSAAGFRARQRRAEDRFADLLVREVAHSLGEPGDAALLREIRELKLGDFCRPALRRRGIAARG
jgi:hypothetical protein